MGATKIAKTISVLSTAITTMINRLLIAGLALLPLAPTIHSRRPCTR
ncbi:hypothetical protein ABZ807_30545 [Micromonospora sp. NPDC047548]